MQLMIDEKPFIQSVIGENSTEKVQGRGKSDIQAKIFKAAIAIA